MNNERIKFLAKIAYVLDELKIEDSTYFGESDQIIINQVGESDFALQYSLSCNEMIKIKETMGCDDIIWSYGSLPGNRFWRFYKLVYSETPEKQS